jgi:hypothetical protein
VALQEARQQEIVAASLAAQEHSRKKQAEAAAQAAADKLHAMELAKQQKVTGRHT